MGKGRPDIKATGIQNIWNHCTTIHLVVSLSECISFFHSFTQPFPPSFFHSFIDSCTQTVIHSFTSQWLNTSCGLARPLVLFLISSANPKLSATGSTALMMNMSVPSFISSWRTRPSRLDRTAYTRPATHIYLQTWRTSLGKKNICKVTVNWSKLLLLFAIIIN